jgi:hypothetical protein
MARFKRLTDDEARQMTRAGLLDRVERESAYWDWKIRRPMTGEDRAAHREFSRIMHAYLDPAAMIRDTIDLLEGRGSGGYMARRPCDDGLPEDPVVRYALRLLRQERERT